MLLCLSCSCTSAYLDRLGEGYDATVLEWKSNIEEAMISSEPGMQTCTQWARVEYHRRFCASYW